MRRTRPRMRQQTQQQTRQQARTNRYGTQLKPARTGRRGQETMPSLMNIFSVAGSAMSAQSQRLNVTASNLANADSTTGPDGQPYRAKQVVFAVDPLGGARTASGQQVGGVQVSGVIDDPSPMKTSYDPSNPAANADGY